MIIDVKPFSELTTAELFDVLRLRAQVFVVEQQCIYQDPDDFDVQAIHLLGMTDNRIIATGRCLPPGLRFDVPSIGRLVVRTDCRNKGWGRMLMEKAIATCFLQWPGYDIMISAQTWLKSFYESMGFVAQGVPYDEDGILHISMRKKYG